MPPILSLSNHGVFVVARGSRVLSSGRRPPPYARGHRHEESARLAMGHRHHGAPAHRRALLPRPQHDGNLTMDMDLIHYGLGRWLHIWAGVMWIGLLYYFNFVQVDALKAAAADQPPTGAGITKHVAPRALFWFRWAAVATVVMGFVLLGGKAGDALLFKERTYVPIGIGAWLGIIMLFNVWMLIWPNQKRILGIVPATDEEKAKARRVAFLASRTNVMLSVPMLFFMSSSYLFHSRAFLGLSVLSWREGRRPVARPYSFFRAP